jgi:hypothetical protein
MKHLAILALAALLSGSGAGFAGETVLPSGTFVFSDDDNYFGRMTITPAGAFTGTLFEALDEFAYGKRVFRGQITFGGETDCILHYPQATYYHPFGPSEFLTIKHTPGGATEYMAVARITIPNRIGPPVTYTYELPGYRVLDDPEAAGFYTMQFRVIPGTEIDAVPRGTGWAVMRLSADGHFRCLGKLPRHESFSFGFQARADRKLDLFRFQSPSTFYPRLGGTLHSVFYGTITLRDVPDVSDADGKMDWNLLIGSERDFITDLSIVASRFVPTSDVLSLLAGDSPPGTEPPLGVATFSHDSFPQPKTARFRFGNPPAVLRESRPLMPGLRWITQEHSFPGRFRGVARPDGGRNFPFSGVFLPKQRTAEGFFLKQGGSGTVELGIDGM